MIKIFNFDSTLVGKKKISGSVIAYDSSISWRPEVMAHSYIGNFLLARLSKDASPEKQDVLHPLQLVSGPHRNYVLPRDEDRAYINATFICNYLENRIEGSTRSALKRRQAETALHLNLLQLKPWDVVVGTLEIGVGFNLIHGWRNGRYLQDSLDVWP